MTAPDLACRSSKIWCICMRRCRYPEPAREGDASDGAYCLCASAGSGNSRRPHQIYSRAWSGNCNDRRHSGEEKCLDDPPVDETPHLTAPECSRQRLAVIGASLSASSWRRLRSLPSSPMPSLCRKGRIQHPYSPTRPLLQRDAAPAPRLQAVQSTACGGPANQARLQLTGNIQRELSRKGFYDGPADGIWGAKTDAAVRDFVQTAGLKDQSRGK